MLESYRILVLMLYIFVVACYPIDNLDAKNDVTVRDEKSFPNGTVVGKYSYTDKDGKAIQVKYYADDSGYGVELNSVKMVKEVNDQNPSVQNPLVKADHKLEPIADIYKYHNYKKSARHDPMDYLNKEAPKNNLKNKYKGYDYEIYLQNDLSAQKCGADVEKVKIYNFEKDNFNKKTRDAIHAEQELDDVAVDTSRFCERY